MFVDLYFLVYFCFNLIVVMKNMKKNRWLPCGGLVMQITGDFSKTQKITTIND